MWRDDCECGRQAPGALEDLGRWLKTETAPVRDGLVSGHERWIPPRRTPATKDAVMFAAAIERGATTIVTANLWDFPPEVLARFDLGPSTQTSS